jgi:hypothetical protein
MPRSLVCFCADILIPSHQVPFSPAKAIFVGIDVLLAVRPFNTDINQMSSDASLFQAASGVSSSYDALLDLFDSLGSFLKRLEIYTSIPPTPIIIDIIVKIIVELLSVLSLATKQIRQGRLSRPIIMYDLLVSQFAIEKFAKKPFGESEVETVLQRLDRLTQDEARITVAQTLSVVHGLVSNTKIVMEGAQLFFDCSLTFCWILLLSDGKASTDSIRQALSMSLARHLVLPVLTSCCSVTSGDRKRSEQDQTFVSPLFSPYPPRPKRPLQVTNCKGISDTGSLLPILQRTTTSCGRDTIKELENGSLRAAYYQIGNRQGRCCGFMANVRYLNCPARDMH